MFDSIPITGALHLCVPHGRPSGAVVHHTVYFQCVLFLFSEKLSLLLSKVSDICESDLKGDSNTEKLQLLKFTEQRANPAKGRHRQ